jgi:hypothetical protein
MKELRKEQHIDRKANDSKKKETIILPIFKNHLEYIEYAIKQRLKCLYTIITL